MCLGMVEISISAVLLVLVVRSPKSLSTRLALMRFIVLLPSQPRRPADLGTLAKVLSANAYYSRLFSSFIPPSSDGFTTT